MGDTNKILAGAGPSALAWFAPLDTVGPLTASAAIPAAFQDAGWCDQSGLVANVNETVNQVKGFGSTQALRTLIADSNRSFDIMFKEHNPTSVAVYNRKPLGSVVPDASGGFGIQIGVPINTLYAVVFDVVDGVNHLRVYCPRVAVSAIKSRTIAQGKEIDLGVTLQPFPDKTGIAVYESYVVAALAS